MAVGSQKSGVMDRVQLPNGGSPVALETLLQDEDGFKAWSSAKRKRLEHADGPLEPAVVDIDELDSVSGSCDAPWEALGREVMRFNFAIYRVGEGVSFANDHAALLAFGRRFGLVDADHNLCATEDKVSVLTVVDEAEAGRRGEYIPYTNRALGWHTDGYYNELDDPIRGFLLHCERNALDGGENELVDPEWIYLVLRERYPELLAAAMENDAMTIPPNTTGGEWVRGARGGPVFWFDRLDGRLSMRFSARARNVIWSPRAQALGLRECILDLIESRQVPVYRYRLSANEGIVCNNVLHNRSAFEDAPSAPVRDHQTAAGRCLLRLRYHDRIDIKYTV